MPEVVQNTLLGVVFALIGAVVGILVVLLSSLVLPRFIDRLTPNLDEGKEIARGNVAVAQYFGLVMGASILGVSLVVAAAVLGGILAALHGPSVLPPPPPS
jgi:hypothetical protein